MIEHNRAVVFEAMSHPTRIKIIRLLHEKPRGFAELKRELGLDSNGNLQHHMGKLAGLVEDDGKYVLTDLGAAALELVEDSERPGASLESLCCSSTPDLDEHVESNSPVRLELDHVHIKFSDHKRTVEFYEALGFKARRVPYENGEYVFIALNKGNIAPSDSPDEKISIGVIVSQLDQVYRLAKEHGVEIVDDIKDRPWGPRSFYVKDPNGYILEFEQAVKR